MLLLNQYLGQYRVSITTGAFQLNFGACAKALRICGERGLENSWAAIVKNAERLWAGLSGWG